MVVNISPDLAEALRKRAQAEGRDFSELLEDAVREYLTSVSITDLSPQQVGETQLALTPELHVPDFDAGKEGSREKG